MGLALQTSDYAAALDALPLRNASAGAGVVEWREQGAGQALVLLHGISSGAASWIGQLTELSQDFRVIAWNAPGYGGSTALTMASPLASDYARVLEDLVDALQLDTFVLAGHSLGALMAAAYAYAHPERVSRLVLMSPARGYALATAEEREGRYTRRMAQLERLGPEGLARERAAALVSAAAPKVAVEWIGRTMRALHPSSYGQAARMLAHDDISRYARGYVSPVTVASGAADQITPPDRCQWVADQYEHAAYQSFPGLGHASYLEDPVQVNAFLREQLSAPAGAVRQQEQVS